LGDISDIAENIVLMDFGNSRVKVWSSDELDFSAFDYSSDWLKKVNLNKNIEKCYYSSVNKTESDKTKLYLKKINFINIKELLGKYSSIDFSEISGMGTDRKLGLIGAASKYILPIITIDSGTAITINLVDENRKCLGGFILPGLQTQAKSLNDYGSGLPPIEIKQKDYALGKNTESAISIGILYGTVGSVEYHLSKIIEKYFPDNQNINIIFTGGGSEILFNILKKSKKLINCKIIRDNNLVFLGLNQIAQAHKKK
jgi:pantothenate kinase type III